ncbi:MAG TPA: response regulator [Pseudomonadales bacterium]
MLEELKQQYRLSLAEKARTLQAMLDQLQAGDMAVETNLRLFAHSLHGSGTTFGYPAISAAARALEQADTDALLTLGKKLENALLEAGNENSASVARQVLIVEDDTDISNLMKVLLAQKADGYRATIAGSAAEARTALAHPASYELIVLDLVLPDGDGRMLLREIRASVAPTVPVFVLSGVDQDAVREECLALGATRYYTKPFNADTIVNEMVADLRTPRASTVAQQLEPKAAPETALAGSRVLLAEDDELLAGIVKHRLARERIEVVHVTSGADAMQALERSGWNLIILDVKMPVHDGFEVLARARALPQHRQVPVVMLTAMGSEKDVVRGYDMGATTYIVKPFSPVELLARVKSLIKA